MSASLPGSLPRADEAVIRKLFKVVRATKFEDPVDQDVFLVDSANTVLKYRAHIASFALVAELSDCVFTIRSMMHANSARLGTPPSDTFVSLQDFAGEIVRKQHLFRERQRANADRDRVVEGMAARVARNLALEYASKQTNKPPTSPDDDAISIPSSSDKSGACEPQPAAKDSPMDPIQVEPVAAPPSSQAAFLSPLNELGVHFGRLSLATPHRAPPNSPLSSNQSLPDLVPDFHLGQHKIPVKGGGWKKGRARKADRQLRSYTHDPVVQCHSLQLVPRHFGPPPLPPKNSFVDDWLLSKPNSVGSPRPRRNYIGNSKPSVNPNRSTRRPFRKRTKRCYYCSAADHLVALCPLRERID
ncbi:hypothetical protein B0H11DRAFT_1962916 [Mycena galericulata]|nr:hypothetical protein B0H11DRAFT_1962916 [Mycena galericulata]